MQFFLISIVLQRLSRNLLLFVCVFAKKFPQLASQSCCEVSRPRAVAEYEYRLLSIRDQLQVGGASQHDPNLRAQVTLFKRKMSSCDAFSNDIKVGKITRAA